MSILRVGGKGPAEAAARSRTESEPVYGPPGFSVRRAVEVALEEDLGRGDLTSELFVPVNTHARADVIARAVGVVAGLPVVREVLARVDPEIRFEPVLTDGAWVGDGDLVARVEGLARGVLAAERVALNFLQGLSGIATLTARYVEAVAGTGARIVDTRKTTPGLRALEKYAVRCGGARNHRFHLGDAVLVKDNHRVALARAGDSLQDAVGRAREALPHTTAIGIEVASPEELAAVIEAGPDWILLDNMDSTELRTGVERVAGRMPTEASGGITLETVRRAAEAGVDLISVGALTHSAPALDISLNFRTEEEGNESD